MIEGIFPIYKEKGPTSNRVIGELKKIVGKAKIGHAGTLDPLAEGVLVVAVGRSFTKAINKEVAKEKEYLAVVRLGETSATDDEEGSKTRREVKRRPSFWRVRREIKRFVGEIEQKPPVFSAIKIRGMEAYKMARRGERPEMKPRKVFIKKIKIISYRWPDLKIRVLTGPGVYIRSLARDLGEVLGTGGYLHSLVRTRVGGFSVRKSLTVSEFKKMAEDAKIK
ncbi:MAG: tRNA pseudouridine(55) synthase TruB [Patescibacteria group bacterium]|nr:tRNA pseudouridine(55) synthase TruB [Patescibacteria group bacterium]MCL5261820.1 tRNA pseudouridine(55) synthase TruB [Patescibacteria group bacterium]